MRALLIVSLCPPSARLTVTPPRVQKVISMAVLLFDRYLSAARQFPRTMLQLAAAAAIFIASKIEGILPHPRASRVAGLSDGAFDLGHLVAFERVMCQTLHFDLYPPTSQNFLDMFMHALPAPDTAAALYFADKVRSRSRMLLCCLVVDLPCASH
jgi:Cyclin, N-terminal domain